ncbi:hypothetical protein [Tateyamaria sp. ANG-S1]|uniref:hypothetical protein n=1 Tax=Tateyamaria sp. ANG-S1 TaxID=1577905 RepID=UPI0005803D5B|nr:hypothetical protein [Tateyamaria sp. ANG-S1]KIC49557.1 hypothetical protein RA29_07685 [Tateyamaria sp. ANG-S1]
MILELAKDFFRIKAFAYTKGQLRFVASLHNIPSEFRMGTNTVVVNSIEDIEEVYQTYRTNLLQRGYDETTVDVAHIEEAKDGRLFSLVQYRNLDKSGDIISEEFASYFLERLDQDILRIQAVEFVDVPHPELLAEWLKSETSEL